MPASSRPVPGPTSSPTSDPGEHRRQARGRRRVGDAHLAAREDSDPVRGGARGEVAPRVDRERHLGDGQRRLDGKIAAGTEADAHAVDPLAAAGHAGVHQHEVGAHGARERRHRAAARREGGQHLRRDGLRVGADALSGHAVVGGRHDHTGVQHGPLGPGHARQPYGQVLQAPQRSRWLDELRLARPRGGHRGLVERDHADRRARRVARPYSRNRPGSHSGSSPALAPRLRMKSRSDRRLR